MRAHSEPNPDDFCAIVDTREQLPLSLAPLRQRVGTLDTGDYSVAGLEHVVRVERKGLQDLVACCGRERERFERELVRLKGFEARLIVVEATWGQLQLGQWQGDIKPTVVMGSLLGWMADGFPIAMCGSHEGAGALVSRFLFIAARRRWRELQAFMPELRLAAAKETA